MVKIFQDMMNKKLNVKEDTSKKDPKKKSSVSKEKPKT